MGRYAKANAREKLSKKLEDKKNLYTIPYKDFNLEVHIQEDADIIIDDIQEHNNLAFAMVSVKSTYDNLPIYFITYIDQQDRLRAFLPKHGNTYNPWTATHFGSERAWEVKTKSITRMPKQYYEENIEQGGYKPTQLYKDEFLNMQANKEMMINEFLRFICIK